VHRRLASFCRERRRGVCRHGFGFSGKRCRKLGCRHGRIKFDSRCDSSRRLSLDDDGHASRLLRRRQGCGDRLRTARQKFTREGHVHALDGVFARRNRTRQLTAQPRYKQRVRSDDR
jgi:hypothetical protein